MCINDVGKGAPLVVDSKLRENDVWVGVDVAAEAHAEVVAASRWNSANLESQLRARECLVPPPAEDGRPPIRDLDTVSVGN